MDMDVWKDKKVFVRLKYNRFYSGRVISIDNNFITLIDKFGKHIMFGIEDINEIKEEEDRG